MVLSSGFPGQGLSLTLPAPALAHLQLRPLDLPSLHGLDRGHRRHLPGLHARKDSQPLAGIPPHGRQPRPLLLTGPPTLIALRLPGRHVARRRRRSPRRTSRLRARPRTSVPLPRSGMQLLPLQRGAGPPSAARRRPRTPLRARHGWSLPRRRLSWGLWQGCSPPQHPCPHDPSTLPPTPRVCTRHAATSTASATTATSASWPWDSPEVRAKPSRTEKERERERKRTRREGKSKERAR